MTLHAATATTPATVSGAVLGVLTLLAMAWLAGYALACWLTPFTPCRHCHGTGARPTPPQPHPCDHCDTTGRRLRLGRQLYNHLHHREHTDEPPPR